MTTMPPTHAREPERMPTIQRWEEGWWWDLALPHDPVVLFIPRLHRQCCRIKDPDVEQALAGKPHRPVVYFARVGRHVKIGTTTNLRGRMLALYLGLEDVLALVSLKPSRGMVGHRCL